MPGVELAKAYVQIVPSAKGIADTLKDEIEKPAEDSGGTAGGKFAAKFKKILGTAAIGKAVKDSLMIGAEYEQLTGGIEKLFGDSSKVVMGYAKNAWKTAQISSNEYMSLATSFSASLLSSLGGDTAKAAEVTNMAVTDMADNVNMMGSLMEDVQNAYKGFSKQNYTMLDNLKLGYGGTKEEMERLLADAEKITGIKYDINNLSDVYEAIHVIQGELNITGTSANEASSTLQGSFNSMKAAYENFMGSLTIGEDVSQSLTNLVESIGSFLANLLPALANIAVGLVPALGTAIVEGIPSLMTSLGEAFMALGEMLKEKAKSAGTDGGGDLIQGFVTSLVDSMDVLLEGLATFFGYLGLAILQNIINLGVQIGGEILGWLMKIIQPISDGVSNFIYGIDTELHELVGKARDKFTEIVTTVKTAAGKITEPFRKAIDKIKGFFKITLKFAGIKLPHISISWKTDGAIAKIASKLGLPGIPSFGVNWYKTGGIFTDPSIIGVGEAGTEAVIPLDKLDQFTKPPAEGAFDYKSLIEALVEGLSRAEQTIVLQLDKHVLVKILAPLLSKEQSRLDKMSNRKLGLI